MKRKRRVVRRARGRSVAPMWKAVYRSGARRTVRADSYFDALRKLTLPSGTQPESLMLVTDHEKDYKAAIAAYGKVPLRGHSMMRAQPITRPSRSGKGVDVIEVSPKGDVLRTLAKGVPYSLAKSIIRRHTR
jgi:hypothetical protein